jgi:hypothetical protein
MKSTIMDNKTFIIKYEVRFYDIPGLWNKEIKVKNCMSMLHAKVKLETWIKGKYKNFQCLIVKDCKEASDMGDLFNSDLFNSTYLKDIFKK